MMNIGFDPAMEVRLLRATQARNLEAGLRRHEALAVRRGRARRDAHVWWDKLVWILREHVRPAANQPVAVPVVWDCDSRPCA
jgi:hypothetical protein